MRKVFLFTLLSLLISCSKNLIYSGKELPSEAVTMIKIGATNKQEVYSLLGSPNYIIHEGDQDAWYYMRTQKADNIIKGVSNLENQVVKINFDKKEIVQDLSCEENKLDRNNSFSHYTTIEETNDTNPIEQFVNNIGRIGSKKRSRRG